LHRPLAPEDVESMKTILVADDEEDVRVIVGMRLSRNPKYRLLEAADGPSALALARKEHPDLLILDWAMPGMNGDAVLKALRQDPATAKIPVIMMTGKEEIAALAKEYAKEGFSYLDKPFSPQELEKKIQEALRLP
jgi:CheY-like chemotaxis protein